MDGLLLNINNIPLVGFSYNPLLGIIETHKAMINIQNSDEKYFKYSPLAKFV